ncbi:hypothetical protein [Bradyrhizobium sp. RD5-C2]|uniref:hypothetical protein n=1 Tax=Bradyrhizobium sp. RD5-C2 TaxID=244562 RepID=UPI001CC6A39E|nr:hypothetical protein [Bradyrhizobium sp. RD5-C2]GIQ73352.1 hypothetical protein BraRD5C2_17900 [Bradyrhizobium sp. RD5-C2]
MSKGKPMRLADFVPKRRQSWRKQSWADIARLAVLQFCGEALGWLGILLIFLAGSVSIYAGLAALLCCALVPTLLLRREFRLDIEALDDPNDNPRANRLIGNASSGASIRRHRSALGQAAPRPDSRAIRALGALEDMALRFVVELSKSVAIVIAMTVGMAFAAEMAAFALSDRDISGVFGSGLAGVAGGLFGLVLGVVIVLRRIADIED